MLAMMTEYIQRALWDAKFEELEDGTIYAEIPGFQGVWAEGQTEQEAREELKEVLQDWVELRLPNEDLDIPKAGGIDARRLVF